MGRIAVGWVAPKDPVAASKLIRLTIAYSVIVKKYLRDEFLKAQKQLDKDPELELHVSFASWPGGRGGRGGGGAGGRCAPCDAHRLAVCIGGLVVGPAAGAHSAFLGRAYRVFPVCHVPVVGRASCCCVVA
jgi:hypothetical protein